MTDTTLQAVTYDVLRQRLVQGAKELRARFERLNGQRRDVFGHLETRLLSTVHVTTEHNCVPRDLLSLGPHLLLGYNVHFGLKSEVAPSDVFSLYRLDEQHATEEPLTAWIDERFTRDFAELYRYYKQTFFSRFYEQGPHRYMVFQVGKTANDIKAFKWLIDGDRLRYVDNRSETEVRNPEQHGFRWTRATRDQHRQGTHPHVSIGDIVFVECVGGDLTIKIEDNTSCGSGIYSEPVENSDQTLDDAEIYFCILGNLVLLKIRPYQEKMFRYLVYSVKRRQAMRLDAMREACTQLPDDHGIIFPGGVCLQTGSYKLFDHGLIDVAYQRTIAAPNGEDFLYQFLEPNSGSYLHLRYNLIRQEVDTPLVCHGQALFEDGRMVTMRAQDAAQKHHALQLWQTPFVGPNFRADVTTDSMLYKIGNRDLVRCMAECQEVLQLIDKDESYADLYVDLVKRTTDIQDSYFWLDREETCQLNQPLEMIRQAAGAAVDEYEKLIRIRRDTSAQLTKSQQVVGELVRATQRARSDSLETFVALLHDLRIQRGQVMGLRELRTIDLTAVDELEIQLQAACELVGSRCVLFLLEPAALKSYRQRIDTVASSVSQVQTVSAGKQLEAELQSISQSLELLVETISGLKIEDLTQRTAIVDSTSDELAALNKVRSLLKAHLRTLLGEELQADFVSQLKLLDQAAAGALDSAHDPATIDQALARLVLQLEELEGRFAEHEEFVHQLHDKREAVIAAFEARRDQVLEAQARRADGLVGVAERILTSIGSRAEKIADAAELRSYFLSDPMVDKVRKTADQLRGLGDTVRAEDVLSKLKALADDMLRQQRDKLELFVDGEDLIRLGQHVFTVNRQPIEVTTIARDGALMLHLTGTQFLQPLVELSADGSRIVPPELEAARDLWMQPFPSESPQVYRAEFLAFNAWDQWRQNRQVHQWCQEDFERAAFEERIKWIREWMQHQPQAGYMRGVHDHDAIQILSHLIQIERGLDQLRYAPDVRGLAWFAWHFCVPAQSRESITSWLNSYSLIQTSITGSQHQTNSECLPSGRWQSQQLGAIASQLRRLLREHVPTALRRELKLTSAVDYLITTFLANAHPRTTGENHVSTTNLGPVVSSVAAHWLESFSQQLTSESRGQLRQALAAHLDSPAQLWQLASSLVERSIMRLSALETSRSLLPYKHELTMLLAHSWMSSGERIEVRSRDAKHAIRLSGFLGDHPRIAGGELELDYHEMVNRLTLYQRQVVPRYMAMQTKKRELLHAAQAQLRVGELKAKVLTSFVRNRLIDEVFLPRIGENLAKQLGAAGDNKRSDRMGLLLLVSPPGYGKTTLVEYIANRLGLALVKINGPALGHNVRSLDPAEASNAAARQELQRINLAFEMGDNVLLYIDDIQHCHSELLQKFIPLCDATRRIEGVWEGQAKTYDLRGRKVAIVMAGNPYTESGQQFQIPDMLANRADVYNLGEIIGGAEAAFQQSYLENCLASNSVLMPLARATREDQLSIIRAAENFETELPEVSANLSTDQVTEMLAVMRKLVQVRDIVLKVNRQYIQSAAQADAYRTEPPFKLQGSYRNMNRIAEKVSPIMNDAELMALVVSAYEQDAQTLTCDGESNLLKFRELAGLLSDQQRQRWEQICLAYTESVRFGSLAGDDQAVQVLKSLASIRDGLETIGREIASAIGVSSLSTEPIRLPEQKVLVQHSVPRSMTDLVRAQHQLLYDGLRCLLEQSATQSETMERLRTSFNEVLNQYGNLQVEIDAAQEPK